MNMAQASPGPCFVAGTLVHAKHGLVPIEELRVGDLVLTRRPTGTVISCKRVTRTIRHDDQRVLLVTLFPDGEKDQHALVCTDATSLLRSGKHGFMRVTHPDMFQAPSLVSLVGECAYAWGARRVFTTGTPGVAWTYFDDQDYFGPAIDLRDNQVAVGDVMENSQPEDALGDEFLATVHRFEVAPGDCCFVGELGVGVSFG